MVEIRQSFRSFGEWRTWRRDIGDVAPLRKAIAEDVRSVGFIEPFTRQKRHPYQIAIRDDDLHESISSAGLNSRKRALLAQLEIELRTRQMFWPGMLRLLGTESSSRLALTLRGLFPYHLAAEVALGADDPERLFTVPFTAPGGTTFPAASLDVFVSGECFRDLADFRKVAPELLRILKPGGLIVAYLPFIASTAAQEAPAGSDPAEWDVLAMLKELGCSDAYVSIIASSLFGIASDGKPGPFIVTAQKAGGSKLQVATPPAVMETRGMPAKLMTLVALPRSGTTLITSMFAVHSEFVASYEPWNSKLLKTDDDSTSTIATIAAKENIKKLAGKFLFVKETAASPEYIRAIRRLHEQTPFPVERQNIFLLRDPDHTLMSEVERRNEWWNDNVTLNQDFIATWAKSRGATLWQIIEFSLAIDGLVVAFEEVAARPEQLMRELADRLGFHFEREQIEYEKHMKSQKARGDLNVSRAPEKIDLNRANARQDKVEALAAMIAATPAAKWFAAYRALHAHVAKAGGILPMTDVPREMLEALRPA